MSANPLSLNRRYPWRGAEPRPIAALAWASPNDYGIKSQTGALPVSGDATATLWDRAERAATPELGRVRVSVWGAPGVTGATR